MWKLFKGYCFFRINRLEAQLMIIIVNLYFLQLQDLSQFQKKGFASTNITGTDISAKMLQVAKEKECYQTLLKLDLTETLPYIDHSFDNILCVGSTTYLGSIYLYSLITFVFYFYSMSFSLFTEFI